MNEEERIARLKQAIKENSDDPGLFYALACALERQNELEPARELFRKIMERFPDAMEAEMAKKRLGRLGIAEEDPSLLLEPLYPHALAVEKKRKFCAKHPTQAAETACFRCEKPLCLPCVIKKGNAILCEACSLKEKARIRKMPAYARWAVLAGASLGTLFLAAAACGALASFIHSAAPGYLPIWVPSSRAAFLFYGLLTAFVALPFVLLAALFQETYPPSKGFEALGSGILTGLALSAAFLWPSLPQKNALDVAAKAGEAALLSGALSWLHFWFHKILTPGRFITWRVGG